MIVLKFGGTSVGNATCMRQVIDVVKNSAHKEKVVVLSAMSGVTNALIAGAEYALKHDMERALAEVESIRMKHLGTINALFTEDSKRADLIKHLEADVERLQSVYQGINLLGELTKRTLDSAVGIGELLSSRIVAFLAESSGLAAQWLDARQFMITDDDFGQANPLWEEVKIKAPEAIMPHLRNGKVIFTQGFIGSTKNGIGTTLGRGGSDYTASIIGVSCSAEEIQIWTDVDGMMSIDPRISKEAHVLPEVSFQEASELAYFGAKVLHPLTIKPAVEKNIPVRILNTLRPEQPGTLIKSEVQSDQVVRAIAAKKNITAIFISSLRMLMSYGFLARVFAVFEKYKTPIDLIATSEISISLTVDNTDHLPAIVKELEEHGEVKVVPNSSIVCAVGRQFRVQPGIAGRMFKALSDVNIIMISGGASDINVSFLVAEEDADKAMKLLHNEFFSEAVCADKK